MASPEKHALLGASSAHRWLSCTPSARLEEAQGAKDEGSPYAAEGTAAHAYAELLLSNRLGLLGNRSLANRMRKVKAGEHWGTEMEEAIGDYADFVMETVEGYRAAGTDPQVDLEQRVDYSEYVPEGFGTADVTILSDGVLHVIDLKYGKGVPVSAEENPQLMLYGLGAAIKYRLLYAFETVRMTIMQPRLGSVSTYELTLAELLEWAEGTVAPAARLAYTGAGEFRPSEGACRWCRAKAVCRARADEAIATAVRDFGPDGSDAGPAGFDAANPPTAQDVADYAPLPETLTIEEVASLLDVLPRIQAWAKDVEGWALEQARDHGVRFPGHKLVEGRSIRVIRDAEGAASALRMEGYSDEEIYKPRELQTITALERLVGKKAFSEILGGLVEKPAGKPALVPESDKRPEIGSAASAAEDFGEAA